MFFQLSKSIIHYRAARDYYGDMVFSDDDSDDESELEDVENVETNLPLLSPGIVFF